MENWAEIRRLHRAESIPIKEISLLLGVARNTVRAALASDRPPTYDRPVRGSLVDGVELEVRKLLANFPRMPSTVIAERVGWTHSITTLKDRSGRSGRNMPASIPRTGSCIGRARSCSVICGFRSLGSRSVMRSC